jgi:hypothetical protein
LLFFDFNSPCNTYKNPPDLSPPGANPKTNLKNKFKTRLAFIGPGNQKKNQGDDRNYDDDAHPYACFKNVTDRLATTESKNKQHCNSEA